MFTRILCMLAVALFIMSPASAEDAPKSKVTLVFDQPIPNIPGKSLRGVLVEYPAGGGSASHTHPSTAFIYATVLEGAVRSQVNDDPEKVYLAGEHFVEMPGDHHGVSANASDSEPARLLAVFVVDTSQTQLVFEDAK